MPCSTCATYTPHVQAFACCTCEEYRFPFGPPSRDHTGPKPLVEHDVGPEPEMDCQPGDEPWLRPPGDVSSYVLKAALVWTERHVEEFDDHHGVGPGTEWAAEVEGARLLVMLDDEKDASPCIVLTRGEFTWLSWCYREGDGVTAAKAAAERVVRALIGPC